MKPKQVERRELWRQWISQQERVGQPIRTFCRERGLNEHLFYAWRQRLRTENKPVAFALIEAKSVAAEASSQPIELLLSGGDRLLIPTNSTTLRLVLSVLREQRP